DETAQQNTDRQLTRQQTASHIHSYQQPGADYQPEHNSYAQNKSATGQGCCARADDPNAARQYSSPCVALSDAHHLSASSARSNAPAQEINPSKAPRHFLHCYQARLACRRKYLETGG